MRHVGPLTKAQHTAITPGCIAFENAHKERCPRGHLLSGANLSASALRLGRRKCLTCNRERDRMRRPNVSGRKSGRKSLP